MSLVLNPLRYKVICISWKFRTPFFLWKKSPVFALFIQRCVTNHPQTVWPKTVTIASGAGLRTWAGFSWAPALLMFSGVTYMAACSHCVTEDTGCLGSEDPSLVTQLRPKASPRGLSGRVVRL